MNIARLTKQIEKSEAAIAKDRDRLDDIIDNAADLRDVCNRALDALQEARDALSELV